MTGATKITFKVEAVLRAQPGVSSSNLYWPITADKVYLFGWLKDADEERRAIDAVRAVKKVKSEESLIARPGKTPPVTTVKKK